MKTFKMTTFIPTKFLHVSVVGLLCILNTSIANAGDAPGILANEPLQTSATAEPNIVFLLDNSQSMVNPSNDINGQSRLQVLKDVLHDIVPELNGVRVGMFTFDSGNGSKMLDSNSSKVMRLLNKSDTDYATTLGYYTTSGTGTIDALSVGSGGTILAESLQDIGRYYANDASNRCGGSASADLTIYPDENLPGDTPPGLKEEVSCSALFGDKAAIKDLAEATVYSCQRNFAIVMSDGETRRDTGLRSDGLTYKDTVNNDGDFENAAGNAWPGASTLPQHPFIDYDQDCTADAKSDGGYGCDSNDPSFDQKISGNKNYSYNNTGGTDYLDDVAQALYEIDLRPDYSEFENNVTTFTVGFGADALNPNHADYNPLMESAADQAGGEYFFADNAATLLSSFQSAIASIISQTSTSSAVTFNSSTLSSQSAVYQALFNTASWSGELNSYPIDGITGQINSSCGSQQTIPANCWKAAEQLDNQDPDDRFIITKGDDTTKSAVLFKYADGTNDYTSLSSASEVPQAFIDDICGDSSMPFPCNASTTADSGVGGMKEDNSKYIQDIVAYLRGDNSQEGPATTRKFRARTHDLGDIVNSSPVFVGEPQQNWPSSGNFPILISGGSTDYKTWRASSVKNRPKVVYVAANDGMLHGFRTTASVSGSGEDVNLLAGDEVFSYIPTGTFSSAANAGLHFLADKDYTHRFYNDLSPTISDVYIDYKDSNGDATGAYSLATKAKDTTTAEWRTVLLGSQGGGGKSLYLLDVTDPLEYTDNAKQNHKKLLLWEFSHPDLGFTYSKPTISMMNNGKFAAIFGSGYSAPGSTSCEAKLFVVFLEGGLDGVWTENTDYFIYGTGAGSSTAGDCNGMSTPAVVDLNKDATADRVYVGDLEGNLWVFDMCAELTNGAGDCTSIAANWGIAHSTPLMFAEGATNVRIPITTKPVVSLDPASSGLTDLIIVFGTGQYLTELDKSSSGLQRMYGVRDYGALSNDSANVNGKWNVDGGTDNKWAITVLDDTTIPGTRIFASTDTIGGSKIGWRIDLNDNSGRERMVVNPKIRNNVVFFNTLIPNDTKCSYGGSGWILSVNLLNGGYPDKPVFDYDGNGTIDASDETTSNGIPAGSQLSEIPAESTFLGDNQYTPGSDGTINIREIDVGENRREGRMSWREIYEAL